jgi:hypothetical protein
MPFKEYSLVSSREEFCRLALQPGSNRRALCRGWGISAETGFAGNMSPCAPPAPMGCSTYAIADMFLAKST